MKIITGLPANFRETRLVTAYLRMLTKQSTCMDRHTAAILGVLGSSGATDTTVPFPLFTSHNERSCGGRCVRMDGDKCPEPTITVRILAEYAELVRECKHLSACMAEDHERTGQPTVHEAARGRLTLFTTEDPDADGIAAAEKQGVAQIIVVTDLSAHIDNPKEGDLVSALNEVCEYHKRLGYPVLDTDEETRYQQAREILLALHMEVAELTNSIQWKPWKHSRTYLRHNFLEECADVLFFMDSLLMLFGAKWPDVATAVLDKVEVTENRINSIN